MQIKQQNLAHWYLYKKRSFLKKTSNVLQYVFILSVFIHDLKTQECLNSKAKYWRGECLLWEGLMGGGGLGLPVRKGRPCRCVCPIFPAQRSTWQRSSFETERVPPSVTLCPHGLGEDAPRTNGMRDVFAHDDIRQVRVSHVFPFNRTAISIVTLYCSIV